MTSASNRPAAVPDADRIDAVADRIATDWGHHGHTALTAMFAELYTDLAVLPTHYTPQQRAQVITDAADTTAGELTTLLDESIYGEADRPPATEYGWTMHTADCHRTITAMLALISADHLTWWLTDNLAQFITDGKTKTAADTPASPQRRLGNQPGPED
ncbi:hypothetical protein [Mycobacteroides abscessus]|uniref:hypothetical protein n=1 Tax=Mycobacteroides abscessus TaxID=36809 RepID=UPI0019D2501F|nr:hypothetical protein [Mycobacteroides abscessus]MBN7374599.1 hypothetical protein [Mycobacteroides abscessus subsp. abscessus]